MALVGQGCLLDIRLNGGESRAMPNIRGVAGEAFEPIAPCTAAN
jgi:hypothetical protein